MLSQKRLILAIQEDLAECRKLGRTLTDIQSLERKKLEVAALLRHQQMAEEAGDDQVELEYAATELCDLGWQYADAIQLLTHFS